MAKLWGGRFSKNTNELVDAFNASIKFDKRLYHEDIRGSIAHDLPETVKIKVSGPRSQVSAISENSLKAYVDFSGAVKGLGTYNVLGKTPLGEIIEISPNLLQLNLDTVGERVLEIEPRIVGVPNSGVTVGKMNLSPMKVTIQGASSRIAEVGKVVVLVDISNKDKNFEDDAAVVAVSKDGREMYDIKVEPSKVHVLFLQCFC